eukprot:Plantae.Rhodophyta-Hildenbrandia_rubra.ctg6939.p1 GENE.Plantae.Rhodophyta-Hildenbrandia_rubra.ctg6939~~Plantae.Rhodophyta-Hildenbrandia_rubra.ctg6939.p1  ORF type:complete len:595 (+),score=110.68 Plantae.Rhodophyta-Hildenbrandia_rubra.ctg6939:3181-4965(+)
MTATVDGSQKYDRQIRIWGSHGQRALERSSVCVIGASATSTEILKNLVLPGVGAFTLIDGATTTATDLGSNFFLPKESLNKNRALCAAECLAQLNDAVAGSYIAYDATSFLHSIEFASRFFRSYSLVIITQQSPGDEAIIRMAEGARLANVPFILARSYGLVASIRIQMPEMCVTDAKTPNRAFDLRISNPFPALIDYAISFELEEMSDTTELSHVPFVVILVQAVLQYKTANDDQLPSTREQKNRFKELVKSLRPKLCPRDAENFGEAVKPANLRLCHAGADRPSDDVTKALSSEKAEIDYVEKYKELDESPQSSKDVIMDDLPSPVRVTRGKSDGSSPTKKLKGEDYVDGKAIEKSNRSFWLHLAAVRLFIEEEGGHLPLRGDLPDMTSSTESYVALQRIYKNKAQQDVSKVYEKAVRISERRERVDFDERTVADCCRNVSDIKVIQYRSLKDEYGLKTNADSDSYKQAIAMDGDAQNNATAYYVMFRASDKFYASNKRFPGSENAMMSVDMTTFMEYVNEAKAELGVSKENWVDEATEMVRFGGGELHNVAAWVGGVAAQEAIKIITGQFVPLNNTLIVNFETMTSTTFTA